uniref:Uncharacterized protein n=1 Tax=Arundo donax TaxID=35708 RepID=A0A0A9AZ60_ARUDO
MQPPTAPRQSRNAGAAVPAKRGRSID